MTLSTTEPVVASSGTPAAGAQATDGSNAATTATTPAGTTLSTEPEGGKPAVGADGKEAPAGDKKDGDGADKKDGTDGDKGADKPIEYKFELPEGVAIDEASLGKFTAVAQRLKLDQASASELVGIVAEMRAAEAASHVEQVAGWRKAVVEGTDFGGDKLPQSLATVRKAVDLGGSELRTFLEETGLGNHPVWFKWAHSVGKALSEGSFIPDGKPVVGDKKDHANTLYPNSK